MTVNIEKNALHSESDYIIPPFTSELASLLSMFPGGVIIFIVTPLSIQFPVVFPPFQDHNSQLLVWP